jgi:hypothetical protein
MALLNDRGCYVERLLTKGGEVTDVSGDYFPRKSQVLRELEKFKNKEDRK